MKRILVIDDDTSQRELLKMALEKAGYEVMEAPNGQAGLQLFRQQPCDLVITDIFMPKEDGIETILHLKTLSSTVKIIAVSGGGISARYGAVFESHEALEAAGIAEADRTLKKPIVIPRLLTTIDELLETNLEENG
jgi:CheY-like chemotaxis protein